MQYVNITEHILSIFYYTKHKKNHARIFKYLHNGMNFLNILFTIKRKWKTKSKVNLFETYLHDCNNSTNAYASSGLI